MLGTVTKILKKFLGDKAEKDIKEAQPLVDKANEIFAGLAQISNDELRGRTNALKARIQDYIREQRDEIKALELQT
ncbi:MAG: hypothetical protein P8N19_06165, partial [Flavobacteriales bacterium]|nr:hypothetical protein [Flavobacteriales bacterium]